MRFATCILALMALGAGPCQTITPAAIPPPLLSDTYYTGELGWWAANADLACVTDPFDPFSTLPRRVETLKLCASTTKDGGLKRCKPALPDTCYRLDGAGSTHLVPGSIEMRCETERRMQVWDAAHLPDWGTEITAAMCEGREWTVW